MRGAVTIALSCNQASTSTGNIHSFSLKKCCNFEFWSFLLSNLVFNVQCNIDRRLCIDDHLNNNPGLIQYYGRFHIYNFFAESNKWIILIWCSFHCKQVFGSVTKPLIEAVQLRHSKQAISDSTDYHDELRLLFLESDASINETNDQPFQRRSSLSLMMRYPATTVHYYWRQFDDKFMRPIFGGRDFVPAVPGTPLGEDEISWNKQCLFCFHFLSVILNIKLPLVFHLSFLFQSFVRK